MQAKNQKLKKPSKSRQEALNRVREKVSKASPAQKEVYLKHALSFVNSGDASKIAREVRHEGSKKSPKERKKLEKGFFKRLEKKKTKRP